MTQTDKVHDSYTSTTEYAATHVVKDVEHLTDESYQYKYMTGVMDQDCNFTAPTLTELIDAIGEAYGIDFADPYVPDASIDGIEWMDFSVREDADGLTDDAGQYLATYSFRIEKRQVVPLTLSDFEGVTYHT